MLKHCYQRESSIGTWNPHWEGEASRQKEKLRKKPRPKGGQLSFYDRTFAPNTSGSDSKSRKLCCLEAAFVGKDEFCCHTSQHMRM
jgi:hypothetical protein